MVFMIPLPLYEEIFQKVHFPHPTGRLFLVVFLNYCCSPFKTVAFLQIRLESEFLSNKSDFTLNSNLIQGCIPTLLMTMCSGQD